MLRTIPARGELDEFEQANIEKALEWSLKNSFPKRRFSQSILLRNYIKECSLGCLELGWNIQEIK